MTEQAENNALAPFKLAVAAGTAVLCTAIIYNAVAGQDGRQRDVLSRLSDLDRHATLPVTIGVGAFDGRPTTKSMVTLEQLAELAANEGKREELASEIERELAALGLYSDPGEGEHRLELRRAIEAYEAAHGLDVTGEPSPDLLDHIRFIGQVQQAATGGAAEVDVRAVQEGLARLGYSPGPPDGVLGSRTREAIRQFEHDRNMAQTGTITDALAQEVTKVLSAGG